MKERRIYAKTKIYLRSINLYNDGSSSIGPIYFIQLTFYIGLCKWYQEGMRNEKRVGPTRFTTVGITLVEYDRLFPENPIFF